ncbi:hypothetical protein SAMN05216276_103665 [Streptosporangium subroseum]|uniref:Uncharacterized protein n=1 Tax=Streptosporangium subroseum TaxID=106412 RepID=A0A239LYW5_9ACTN|nr:hypothetical protein [Streptosporangium subroseum]SNT35706.1 hypothetical protein SAMN05216276_103665 [Streptosporangium subroseum]
MDFFTAPPPPSEPEPVEEMVHPAWVGPPDAMLGGTVPIERTVFRSEALVIVLTSAVAFPEGVKLHTQMAARRVEGVSEKTWWDRHELFFGVRHHRGARPGEPLGDEVLRFGVRFPDGGKATTVDGRQHPGEWPPPRPEGPLLRDSGGGGGGGGDHFVSSSRKLWLWPLPPSEPFEFVVEWPAFDVPLTFVEIDGALIAAAAERARPYWP